MLRDVPRDGDGDGDGDGSDWTPSPGRSRFVRRTRRRWRPGAWRLSRGPRRRRRGPSGEPAHTNVTPGFTDCIDYVFVSEGVEVMAAEPISGVETTRAGLPDHQHPSDHLPLTLTLEY